MSTGGKTISLPGGYSVDGYYFSKSWNGANGKYSSPGVLKWNSYSMTGVEQKYRHNAITNGTLSASSGIVTPTWTTNDELALITQIASRYKSHSFNLGVAVAEGRQTVGLVRDTAVRVFNCVRSLKRGRFDLAARALGVSPRKSSLGLRFEPKHDEVTRRLLLNRRFRVHDPSKLTSKEISSMWLELQYGWKPLISDVYESAKAFSAIADQPRVDQFTAKGSNSVTKSVNDSYADCTYNATAKFDCRVICRRTEVMPAARSLGLEDPATIAWELVPFSFVVDWFIPIGTYLEALHVAPTLSGAFLRTNRQQIIGMTLGKGSLFPQNHPSNAYPTKGLFFASKNYVLSRGIVGGFAVPRPSFKSLSEALSPGHIKNALALMHQVLF